MSAIPSYSPKLEVLILDCQPRLAAYARHFLKDEKDVEDVVQDTFLTFWKRYSADIEDDAECGRILFTVLKNKCIDLLRHRKLVDGTFVRISPEEGELLYNADFLGIASEQDCLYADLNRQIMSVLDKLPSRCREVFELSRFQHKKNSEIAQILGISKLTVEKHVSRALAAFRKALSSDSSILFVLFVASIHHHIFFQ